MAVEDLDWIGKQEMPMQRKLRLPLGWYVAPVIVPAESASVSISIGVGVNEQTGEVIQSDVIHVEIRVLGYTNSLAARRYRR